MRAIAPVTQDGVSGAFLATALANAQHRFRQSCVSQISVQSLARKERASKFMRRAFAGLVAGE